MKMTQATKSLEIVMEVDPFEIAEIFGNVGGFWGGLQKCGCNRLGAVLWPKLSNVHVIRSKYPTYVQQNEVGGLNRITTGKMRLSRA